MKASGRNLGLRLRVVLAPNVAFGPGKTALLAGIAETGSIAAAGRALGMSYARAWRLVEELNGCFPDPLVAAAKGGARGGGARLTPLGLAVLRRLARMQAAAQRAVRADIAALKRLRGAAAPDAARLTGRGRTR
ncbi:MAG: LysR family transcriptional regulator [Alphaproteobacteria bacterium]|nr:LysR family transcriptional regulator [Alphaproteobacteria bacterium]